MVAGFEILVQTRTKSWALNRTIVPSIQTLIYVLTHLHIKDSSSLVNWTSPFCNLRHLMYIYSSFISVNENCCV